MKNVILAALPLALALTHCGTSSTSPDAATSSDASPDADVCMLSCPMPAPGCRYEGAVTCDPPSCGRVVCPDDAGADAVADGVADVPDATPVDAPDSAADVAADARPDAPVDVTADAPVDARIDVQGDAPTDAQGDAPADARDAAVDANDAGTLACGVSSVAFPPLTRACAVDADCFAAWHQTDCCGNVRVTGLAARDRAAFDAAEAACRRAYPACGCPAQAPLADDGMRSFTMAAIGVACRVGVCSTFVR